MISQPTSLTEKYVSTLGQAVSVLSGITGNSKFEVCSNEFENRLYSLESQMKLQGINPYEIKHSLPSLDLSFKIFQMKVEQNIKLLTFANVGELI